LCSAIDPEIKGMNFVGAITALLPMLNKYISASFCPSSLRVDYHTLILISQMILVVMFNFDKLNNMISTKGEAPVIADVLLPCGIWKPGSASV